VNINDPGKYDADCTTARQATGAQACLLIILDGYLGTGFSVQCTHPGYVIALPEVLRAVADKIEAQQKQAETIVAE